MELLTHHWPCRHVLVNFDDTHGTRLKYSDIEPRQIRYPASPSKWIVRRVVLTSSTSERPLGLAFAFRLRVGISLVRMTTEVASRATTEYWITSGVRSGDPGKRSQSKKLETLVLVQMWTSLPNIERNFRTC